MLDIATYNTVETFENAATISQLLQNPYPAGFFTTNDPQVSRDFGGTPLVRYDYRGSGLIAKTVLQSVRITDFIPDNPVPVSIYRDDGHLLDSYAPVFSQYHSYFGPLPVGTSLYSAIPLPPPSSPYYLYVDIATTIDGFYYLEPTSITADVYVATAPPTATSILLPGIVLPPSASTLEQAAKSLGYDELKWVQEITIPAPSPFRKCGNAECTFTSVWTGTINDAPEFGWDYCNVHSPAYNPAAGGDCSTQNPYYPYQTSFGNGSRLHFEDVPANDCLYGGSGDGCGGHTSSALQGFMSFKTILAGVTVGHKEEFTDIFDFRWIDTFNGTSGGISTTANVQSVDAGSGTGGITLIEINGLSVPEPSTFMLLGLALVALGFASRQPHRATQS